MTKTTTEVTNTHKDQTNTGRQHQQRLEHRKCLQVQDLPYKAYKTSCKTYKTSKTHKTPKETKRDRKTPKDQGQKQDKDRGQDKNRQDKTKVIRDKTKTKAR
jgi:hypothetical protein